jgi:hypothetical protein
VLLCVVSGCVAPTGGERPTRAIAQNQHSLFNPYWTDPSAYHVSRSDWPSTRARQKIRETVTYHETSIDSQGRGYRDGQDYYRRFTTYRTGTVRP